MVATKLYLLSLTIACAFSKKNLTSKVSLLKATPSNEASKTDIKDESPFRAKDCRDLAKSNMRE